MIHYRKLALISLISVALVGCESNSLGGVSPCDNDGVCDTVAGENVENCPGDCVAPPVCNDNGVCESWNGETYENCLYDCPPPPVCNNNGICEAYNGESSTNCPYDCPPMGCDFDGVCELGNGENASNCPSDCGPTCDMNEMTGPNHNVLVHELYLPDTSQTAGENGVDLDGDGDIDNKLGQIVQLIMSNGMDDDINEMINGQILSGSLAMVARVKESGNYDGGVAVQTFQGLPGAPPAWNGSDHVTIDPTAPTDLWLCGRWAPPVLETDPGDLVVAFPMPMIGTTPLRLSHARLETVLNPANPYYGNSALTAASWDNVMLGGGLSTDEVENSLVPAFAAYFQDLVYQGGSTADTIVDLFDGNCIQLNDVPACQNVIPGEGECDDSASPAIITTTEVLCNALISSALAPDVDLDGDGQDEHLSVGLRIVHAVPVNVSW